MKRVDFVHLHVHTSFSLLDGACRVSDLTTLAAKMRFPALAITDHGGMFGVIDFYQSALSAGIKPIIGSEFYVAPGSRMDKTPATDGDNYYHVVLLARNLAGYHNLLKLSSSGFREGFYYKPRIDREILSEYSEGLIALSACLKGEVARRIVKGKEKEAVETAAWYRDVFGDAYYLEIMRNGLEEQARANEGLARISADLGISMVATNDIHYLQKEDRRMHDVLLCIQMGKTVNAEDRMRMDAHELYLKSADEMGVLFRDLPEALANTLEVAERCNLEIPLHKTQMPRFPVPEDRTPQSFLADTVRAGFERRMEGILAVAPTEERESVLERYQTRLGKEIETITAMGFSGYFLIVWDFIRFAKEKGVPVGPGRGSAAGSLVAYSLAITDIDPLRYGLLFERFLNPERVSMPDIDVDFCMDRRDEVIRYVSEKYGEDKVAQIITFGTMAARGAIRDVGRALDISYAEVDRIAKMIPDILKITISQAIEQEPQLREIMKKEKKIADLLDLAQKIEGLHRHASTHAAGVVISQDRLDENVPLYRGTKGEAITQFTMKNLEEIGLVKFDFLGLRTLTLLDHALKLVNRRLEREGSPALAFEDLNLEDPGTYELLSSANTDGVFQLESSGMKDLLNKMKPGTFEDLIALVALYRPGPLGSGMVTDFINRKRGRQSITYEVPELKEILEETYGVIVYQEQVMQIASALAGYSLGEADILRRAMGKKKHDEMEKQRTRFQEGCKKKGGISSTQANKIFDTMEYFAGYGFNKSHSAAYALISFRTAHLKAHYPMEFMAALLTSEMDNTDKVTQHIGVCKEMGISLLPPDINESDIPFTVTDSGIRFGLGAVKNAGAAALEEILGQRDLAGEFFSLEDFCGRVDLRKVNRRVIESLIKSGAFDGFSGHRARNIAGLDQALERGQKEQRDRINGQINMFGRAMGIDDGLSLPDVEPWTEHLRLTFEKESLGFYISGHPLEKYMRELERYVTSDLGKLGELGDGQEVRVAGVKQSIKEINTKKGDRMAFLTLEDLHGSAELVIFSDVFKKYSSIIASDKPMLVEGVTDSDGENPKIMVQKMSLLEDYREKVTNVVQINLTTLGLTREDLSSLKAVLARHSGECKLRLKLAIPTKAEAVICAEDSLRVGSSDRMVREVEDLLGSGTVTFE